MTDLDRLKKTLDILNVYYNERIHEYREDRHILIDLCAEEGRPKDMVKVPYTGYSGFAWIFTFDMNGKIIEVGGYE